MLPYFDGDLTLHYDQFPGPCHALSGEILGSVDMIIYGVDFYGHSCTRGLPLKLYSGFDGVFLCE